MKKLRSDCAQGMSATIPTWICCLPIYYKKYEPSNIQTQGSGYCFVWIWNLVSHIEGGTEVEGVRECGRSLGRRRWRNLRNAEFLPFIPYQILLGWSNQEEWNWQGMWNAWMRGTEPTGFTWGKLRRSDYLDELGVDGKMNLKRTCMK